MMTNAHDQGFENYRDFEDLQADWASTDDNKKLKEISDKFEQLFQTGIFAQEHWAEILGAQYMTENNMKIILFYGHALS